MVKYNCVKIKNEREKGIMLKTNEWLIYNYIKERSEKGLWTKQQEIVDYLLERYETVVHKRMIRKYINNIRQDDVIQKIILTSYSKGYRLMTSEEEFEYLERRKISVLKMLKQYHKDVNRFAKDNQTRLTFTPYERDVIESLLKLENKGE